MSPERQAFKNIEEWLDHPNGLTTPHLLKEEAIKAFYEQQDYADAFVVINPKKPRRGWSGEEV